MTITLFDGRTALYQWDTGRRLIVAGLPEGAQVHLAREGDSDALQAPLTPTEGGVSALIPDELLQSDGKLKVWLYAPDETGYSTHLCIKTYPILPRPKPADYVYTPTETALWTKLEGETAEHEKRLAAIEQRQPELIGELTLEENSESMALTADLEGNAFQIVDYSFEVTTPTNSPRTLYLAPSTDQSQPITHSASTSTIITRGGVAFPLLSRVHTNTVTNSGGVPVASARCGTPNARFASANDMVGWPGVISGLVLWGTGTTVIKGSVIRLWGVRV